MTAATAVKQVVVVRRDLNMRRGKECARVAHASMIWLRERLKLVAGREDEFCAHLSPNERSWVEGSFAKVVCQVPGLPELVTLYQAARTVGLEAHLVVDEGRTEFAGSPTTTCLAIGPDLATRVDEITGHLKLY